MRPAPSLAYVEMNLRSGARRQSAPRRLTGGQGCHLARLEHAALPWLCAGNVHHDHHVVSLEGRFDDWQVDRAREGVHWLQRVCLAARAGKGGDAGASARQGGHTLSPAHMPTPRPVQDHRVGAFHLWQGHCPCWRRGAARCAPQWRRGRPLHQIPLCIRQRRQGHAAPGVLTRGSTQARCRR